ncbi:MAG: hypothetical protein ACTSRA_01305 [Promethearchaeota archaeon]
MLTSFFNRVGIRLINKRLYRWSFFEEESRRIFSSIDLKQFEELVRQYPQNTQDEKKTRQNQILFVYLAHVIGLHRFRPKRILDIGSKAGIFPFIARYYGHDGWASDIPEVLAREPNKGILKLLRVPSLPLKVEANVSIPSFGKRFDLVTGFRTRFHSRYTWETGKAYEEHWGIGEWDFFLKDLAKNHMTSNGRIFFMLNRLQEREKGALMPPQLKHYFQNIGARVRGEFLEIQDLRHLR